MTEADLVRRQAERWADPQTHRGAEERMARAKVGLRQVQPAVQQKLRNMERSPTFARRLIWLREAVDTATGAVAPHSPCKAGCSHCCHQTVLLTQSEAQVIARETGAKLAQPASWRYEPALEFSGQACPFLKDSRCSIYAQRPIACRQLVSMDADSLLCEIVPGSMIKVPYADLRPFQMILVQAHDSADEALKVADIRDFFPRAIAAK